MLVTILAVTRCYDLRLYCTIFLFFTSFIISPSLAAPVAPSPSIRRPLHDPHSWIIALVSKDRGYQLLLISDCLLAPLTRPHHLPSSHFVSLVVLYLLYDSL